MLDAKYDFYKFLLIKKIVFKQNTKYDIVIIINITLDYGII